MANAPAFEDAVSILEQLEGISIGVHLNIIEFSTLKEKLKHNSLLYDQNGQYKNGFVQILLKSFNEEFLEEVEQDVNFEKTPDGDIIYEVNTDPAANRKNP